MQATHGQGQAGRGADVAAAALLTAEDGREAAELLSVEGLVVRAQDYLAKYGKDLRSERGGVPIELAAVLGVLRSGKPGFFWYISPAAQRRLDVGRKASPALQLWAGLRLVNEAAILLEQIAATVQLPVLELAGEDWWAAVLRLEALGPRTFVELCRRAGGALELGVWAAENDPGLGELPAGVAVYRILAAKTWVLAAAELAASLGRVLEVAPGQLIGSRDQRVQAVVKKATLGGYAIAQLAQLAKAKGIIP